MRTDYRLYLIGVFFSLLTMTSPAMSQSDTVRYRLLTSYLPDSSNIKYELGSIALKQNGDTRFLRFALDSVWDTESFFKSEPFRVNSPSDSLSIFRFAGFDNKFQTPLTQAEVGSSSWNTLMSIFKNRYFDTVFYVSPEFAYFNSSSYVSFVSEIRRSSNNSVLKRIDTLKCYLIDGKFKYTNYPFSRWIQKSALSGIPSDTDVYLTVKRVTSLPSGSSIIATEFTFQAFNRGTVNDMVDDSGYYLLPSDFVGSPAFAPPIQSKLSSKQTTLKNVSIKPMPTTGYFEISFKSVIGNHNTKISIYNSLGGLIFGKDYNTIIGDNTILIDASRLTSGSYQVFITTGTSIVVKKQIIIN